MSITPKVYTFVLFGMDADDKLVQGAGVAKVTARSLDNAIAWAKKSKAENNPKDIIRANCYERSLFEALAIMLIPAYHRVDRSAPVWSGKL